MNVLEQALQALELCLHWPVEPATTDDGCYTDDPEEKKARAAIAALRAAIERGPMAQIKYTGEPKLPVLEWLDSRAIAHGALLFDLSGDQP